MKKIYNSPRLIIVQMNATVLQAISGGVGTGSKPGDEYNPEDPTYAPYYGYEDNEEDW